MKNSRGGFVIPLIVAIIALLMIGGGATYYYTYTKTAQINNSRKTAESMKVSAIAEAKNIIIGYWQNRSDPKDTVTYNSDGTFTTAYEGTSANSSGMWDVVDTLEGTSYEKFDDPAGALYLKTSKDYYALQDIRDKDTFGIVILGRGMSVVYTRVKITQTVGWKTYTNSKWNYSISYPNDYVVSAGDQNDISINTKNIGIEIQSGSEKFARAAGIALNYNLLNKDEQRKFITDYFNEHQIQEVGIGNIKFMTAVTDGPVVGSTNIYYAFGNDGDSFHTILVVNGELDPKVINQILATFKSTK